MKEQRTKQILICLAASLGCFWLGNRVGLLYVSAVGMVTQRLAAAVNLSKIVLHPLQLSSAPIPVGCGVGAILLVGLAYLCIKYSGHRLVPQKEYGSARWGTAADIAPFLHEKPSENIPLTATESLSLAMKIPVTAENNYNRNKNVIVFGPSGSGKSTVAKLIAGYWDVTSGSITLGGHELKDMPLSEIADQISYVSQDNYLFNRSIRENIRMGRPSATDTEVEQAAKQSGCDAFIRKLDNGYDTVVGSAGSHLSGGERQRIAIARAMLKNAPVVILDEATAYIDPENEALVQKAISTLTVGKTLIVIAHRLSTIVGADNIVVVKDGTIHAQGTHEKLLETCPLYRDMWQAHIGAKDQM